MVHKQFTLLIITLCSILACNEEQKLDSSLPIIEHIDKPAASIYQYNTAKGFGENGNLITDFNCPDTKSFPPIDIKSWNKIPVVNGRFPTYEETTNGTSIHHYGEIENSNLKVYPMTLPRLAYRKDLSSKMDSIVVVIQIVHTANDTIVSYRYLSGGCGGSKFHNFHFLTDEEVKEVMER